MERLIFFCALPCFCFSSNLTGCNNSTVCPLVLALFLASGGENGPDFAGCSTAYCKITNGFRYQKTPATLCSGMTATGAKENAPGRCLKAPGKFLHDVFAFLSQYVTLSSPPKSICPIPGTDTWPKGVMYKSTILICDMLYVYTSIHARIYQ